MNLSELFSQLRENGLYPIRVESIPDGNNDLEFVGSLIEFIQTAKAVQSPVVFVSAITLSEDHFLGDDPAADDENENDADERIDLCTVLPELESIKCKIGEDGHFALSFPCVCENLKFEIVEDWMVTFAKMHSKSVQILRQTTLDMLSQEEAIEEAKAQHLLNNLRGLIEDIDFVRLPTQRAMLAYALDDFPELEELGKKVLTDEIQNLKAKIDAKGLRRK